MLMDDFRNTVGGDMSDLALELGRNRHPVERAGDQVAGVLGRAVDDDAGFLEQLGKLMVASLAVGGRSIRPAAAPGVGAAAAVASGQWRPIAGSAYCGL